MARAATYPQSVYVAPTGDVALLSPEHEFLTAGCGPYYRERRGVTHVCIDKLAHHPEEAANFYVSLLPGSQVDAVHRAPMDTPSGPAGMVLTVEFTLNGTRFVGLNGGPYFRFTEAVSFQIGCDSQDEVDRLWSALSQGGEAGQCGWLKDRYGLSWQIVPNVLPKLLADPDAAKARRVGEAMMKMHKLDIAVLEKAAAS